MAPKTMSIGKASRILIFASPSAISWVLVGGATVIDNATLFFLRRMRSGPSEVISLTRKQAGNGRIGTPFCGLVSKQGARMYVRIGILDNLH
jgi:hypothetical protein